VTIAARAMTSACSTQCPLDIDVKAERVDAAQQPRSVIILGRAEATESAQSAADARFGRAMMAAAVRPGPLEPSRL
jgi:Fe-S oxidoreductase